MSCIYFPPEVIFGGRLVFSIRGGPPVTQTSVLWWPHKYGGGRPPGKIGPPHTLGAPHLKGGVPTNNCSQARNTLSRGHLLSGAKTRKRKNRGVRGNPPFFLWRNTPYIFFPEKTKRVPPPSGGKIFLDPPYKGGPPKFSTEGRVKIPPFKTPPPSPWGNWPGAKPPKKFRPKLSLFLSPFWVKNFKENIIGTPKGASLKGGTPFH